MKRNPAAALVLDPARESLVSSSGALLMEQAIRLAGLDRGLSTAGIVCVAAWTDAGAAENLCRLPMTGSIGDPLDPVGGQTNFRRCRLLEPLPPGGYDRDVSRLTVSPQGDGCFPSEPDHRLEDHGCRPQTPTRFNKLVYSLTATA